MPNATRSADGSWQIPAGDLSALGLEVDPTKQGGVGPSAAVVALGRGLATASAAAPALTPVDSTDPLVSASYARLRAEFAEAYANVQAERLMAEAEKWKLLAEERDRSLQRADEALKTVAIAVESAARLVRAAAGLPDDTAPRGQAPQTTNPVAPPGTVRYGARVGQPVGPTFVAVPDHVRMEAARLAEALHSSSPNQRRRGRMF